MVYKPDTAELTTNHQGIHEYYRIGKETSEDYYVYVSSVSYKEFYIIALPLSCNDNWH